VVTPASGDARPTGDALVAGAQAEVRRRLPGAATATIQNWRPADRGFSTETYLFEVGGIEHADRVLPLVLRRPPAVSLFPDYDLRRQVLVMQRLAASPLPVPTVRWFDPDGGAVGGPYFVMDHIESIGAPSDVPTYHQSGLYLDATPAQRTGMWDACLRMIASVHEVDWRAAGLSFLAPGRNSDAQPSPGAALVDYLDRALHWADPRPPASLEAAIAYLRAHLHDSDPPVLCWGDARLSNLLFDRDLDPVAVLDWEISYLGDHEADVAWFLFTEWASTVPDGIEPLEGTPGRDWVLDRYETLTGLPLRRLHYNEVLAPLLLSVPLTRLGATLDLGDDIDLTGFCCRRVDELLATSP
jgi:aminoglycoside phosphotransferase (APT) family kinase protein